MALTKRLSCSPVLHLKPTSSGLVASNCLETDVVCRLVQEYELILVGKEQSMDLGGLVALSLLFATLGLFENRPHVLSVGRSLSFVFWGMEECLVPFGLGLLAFLLEAELWPFVHSRFEPALLGVTLVFATPKTVFLLGAAPLKRLFHYSKGL